MRILYFSTDYSYHDHRFLASLAEAEHEVFFLRLETHQRSPEDRPIPARIRQVRWPGAGSHFTWSEVPRLVGQLRQVLREVRPDLVHAGPIQTCAFLAALAGARPLLTMSWGFDLMQDVERGPWWRWVTRYTLRRSSYFVSDAQVTRERAIAYGMRTDRTAVFPWGVDLERFRPAAEGAKRKSFTLDNGKPAGRNGKRSKGASPPFVIFCNRSWELRYGVDVMARAFVHVARQKPEAALLLLGGGSMAHTLRQTLMKANLTERVTFAGQISQKDLPRWYHMADLYVSPSHVDGSSVSLMEAMASGLPVVVSDIPANKEWVADGANGWLFPDGNADALADCIVAAMEHPKQLRQLARAARKTAEERADWPKNFQVLLQAYDRALNRKR